jgi:hypothetical protein
MGIFILGALALYLLASIGIVWWAIQHAKKNGKSVKKWGWGAALVMYLIPFWDWIPTLAVHQYYCQKEAGFWVYKTLDEWKRENPGVAETLVANKGYPSKHEGDMANYTTTNFLNSRFNLVVKHRGPLFLHRWLREDALVDAKTSEVLSRYVDFSTSQQRRQAGWSGWKFWLDNRQCIGGQERAIESGKFMNQFTGVEK